MTQRFSKNRQAILQILAGTKSHPSAERIYEEIRQKYPNISLGTVYRNLSQLKENGVIRSVGMVNGVEHYDFNAAAHPHAVCSVCGAILDVADDPSLQELIKKIENITDFRISELQFTGICPKCSAEVGKGEQSGQ